MSFLYTGTAHIWEEILFVYRCLLRYGTFLYFVVHRMYVCSHSHGHLTY